MLFGTKKTYKKRIKPIDIWNGVLDKIGDWYLNRGHCLSYYSILKDNWMEYIKMHRDLRIDKEDEWIDKL